MKYSLIFCFISSLILILITNKWFHILIDVHTYYTHHIDNGPQNANIRWLAKLNGLLYGNVSLIIPKINIYAALNRYTRLMSLFRQYFDKAPLIFRLSYTNQKSVHLSLITLPTCHTKFSTLPEYRVKLVIICNVLIWC